MILTGKCKEAFVDWYYATKLNDLSKKQVLKEIEYKFFAYPFSMQYGVFVDFFDGNGIVINIEPLKTTDQFTGYVKCWKTKARIDILEMTPIRTRHEAREKAIEAANKIYNERDKQSK